MHNGFNVNFGWPVTVAICFIVGGVAFITREKCIDAKLGIVSCQNAPSNSSSSPELTPKIPLSSSPEAAIEEYYTLLDQGQYRLAWNKLSDRYKTLNNLNFDTYEAAWKKINSITLSSPVKIVEKSSIAVTVRVVSSLRKGDEIHLETLRTQLIQDGNSKVWLIDAQELEKKEEFLAK